ncbi:Serine/threonine-protein kinase edr1 [Nowakowskiella sp. JEL0407]|nr:Serine/threonine-protein kinase edr1 [Nowakowskiella sp. JEL0407]
MGEGSKFKYDLFLSYSLKDEPSVLKVREALKARKLNVCLDGDEIYTQDRAEGIDSSAIIVCFLSKSYEKSDSAMVEFRYAFHTAKSIIGIRLEVDESMSEIEVVVQNSLWFSIQNDDPRHLSQTVYYIEKEVYRLNPRIITGNMPKITLGNVDFSHSSECIGSGGVGSVYKIKFNSSEDVVFKRLRDTNPSLKAKNELLKLAETMSSLSHPRLVRFYGIVDDPMTSTNGIVIEYAFRGSLFDIIKHSDPISLTKRFLILLDAATGINALHDEEIIHENIKTQNILVDEQWRAKICDFGLTRVKQELTLQNPTNTGMAIHTAPELLSWNAASKATDTFSFSLVMCEVFTWSLPYLKRDENARTAASNIPMLKLPDGVPSGVSTLLSDCMNTLPEQRPSFATICLKLLEFLRLTNAVEQANNTIDTDLSEENNSILIHEITLLESIVSPPSVSINVEATFYQAMKYLTGVGAKHNMRKAFELFKEGADTPHIPSCAYLAFCYELDPAADPSLIFKYSKLAADAKNAMGMSMLGFCFYFGKGTAQDYDQAVHLFRNAIDASDKDGMEFGQSCSFLGHCYQFGKGVEANQKLAAEYYQKALTWKRKAAYDGELLAQYQLGVYYRNGYGVTKDEAEAVKWCTKAADQGLSNAQDNLGVLYQKGYGVRKNDVEAFKWFSKAADQGNANSQFALGVCYKNGFGIKKDCKEAVKWYRKAAEQEYAIAEVNLAICYETGLGVEKDSIQAVNWYSKAAHRGNAIAQYALGVIYERGVGVEKDDIESMNWYSKSAEQGHKQAKAKLKASSSNSWFSYFLS